MIRTQTAVECQDMNCDSLSGLTNAHSASVVGNRAVWVNVLQCVYWKISETGVSKFGLCGNYKGVTDVFEM
jgi:hypothetical protein